MAHFPLSSLRTRLTLLVLLALLPALGLIVWNGLALRRVSRDSAHQEALRVARSVRDGQGVLVEAAHHVLAAVSRVPVVSRPESAECQEFSASLVAQLPQFTSLLIARPDGEVLCAPDGLRAPVNLGDRAYFRQALDSLQLSVGEYVVGRVTGEPLLPFAFPLLDGRGRADLVLVTGLRLDWLGRLAGEADLPAGSQLTVFDRLGTVLARYPDPGGWIGRSASESELGQVVSGPADGVREVAGLDGVERLYASVTLRYGSGEVAHVTVGIPAAAAYSDANRTLVRNLAWLGAVIFAALVASWGLGGILMVRPAQALARAAQALGEGNLAARTWLDRAPGELGEVARAFDRMAEEMEHREGERRESEATLRALLDGNPESLVLLDAGGRVLAGNEAAAERLSVSPTEMVGENMFHLVSPEAAFLWRARAEEAVQTRMPVRFEDQRAGRFLDNFLQPILDKRGQVFQVAVLSVDVTDRRREKTSLLRANRALRTLTAAQNSAADAADEADLFERICRNVVEHGGYRMAWVGIAEEDPERRIRPAARAGCDDGYVDLLRLTWAEAERGLGPTGTAIRTGRFSAARDIAADPSFAPWREEARRRGYASALAMPLHAGGRTFAALTLYAPEPDAFDDEEVGLLADVARAVSQGVEARRTRESLRQSEERLLQAQRLESVGRLAGGVAHDFNNLLQIILGHGELLLEPLAPGDSGREGLTDMVEAARRAVDLTRQLLAFSRRQVLEPRSLDLNQVVDGLERMLRRLIGEDIHIETRLDPSLGRTLADPGQIEQVLMNLALNARDAMPDGGKLTFETRNIDLDEDYARQHPGVKPGPHVMLAVSDTGAGMTREVAARIFEPFFTTKERGKGTGLGLATVYGIVKQSGGDIWVYSEPGHGSTFKVYLPRTGGAQARVEPEGLEPAAEARTGAVLVVEDEKAVRAAVVAALVDRGYTVYAARNPGDALALFDQVGPGVDLLITDVVLPGMSGQQLSEQMKARSPGLRVLFMSGYTDDAIVHHGVLDPGLFFLEKPFSGDSLARKVREVLRSTGTAEGRGRTPGRLPERS